MKYIKKFRKKIARIILISIVVFGFAFHQMHGMQLEQIGRAFFLALTQLMQRSPVVVDALTKAVESVRHAILGGHTQEAIKQSNEMYDSFKNCNPKASEGIASHRVNVEHIEVASPEQEALEQQYLYSVIDNIIESSPANISKGKNVFGHRQIDSTKFGRELFLRDAEAKRKQELSSQSQEYVQKKMGQIAVTVGLIAKDLALVCRKAVAQMAREDLEDEQIAHEIKTNPIFAQAFYQAYEYAIQTVCKAVASNDYSSVYLIEMNRITLPGSYGRAYDALVEKINAMLFSKDGQLIGGKYNEDFAGLLSNFVKANCKNNKEYHSHLSYIQKLSGLRELRPYIKAAEKNKVKFAAANGFIRFCCKILPERFSYIGKIKKSVITNNKHNQWVIEFLQLCRETDINDKRLDQYIANYDKQSKSNRFYAPMHNLLKQLRIDAHKKLNLNTEGAREFVNLTPKVQTQFVNNGAGPGPGNPEFLPPLPEVEPVKIPDMGGAIISPEHPVSEGASPIRHEPEPASCGVGQQKVEIPGIHIDQQKLPSLGAGMGLGDNPIDNSSKIPNPDLEEDKIVISKPENKVNEIESDRVSEVDIEKVKQQKIKEYEQAISELEKIYTAEGVQEAVNNLKVSKQDVLNNPKLLEQVLAEVINVSIERGIAVFKDGYYYVNGFRFTEYYYKRVFEHGRPYPTLVAEEILRNPEIIEPHPKLIRYGYYWYKTKDWEMIYNPDTKEIQHIQQIKKKKS